MTPLLYTLLTLYLMLNAGITGYWFREMEASKVKHSTRLYVLAFVVGMIVGTPYLLGVALVEIWKRISLTRSDILFSLLVVALMAVMWWMKNQVI